MKHTIFVYGFFPRHVVLFLKVERGRGGQTIQKTLTRKILKKRKNLIRERWKGEGVRVVYIYNFIFTRHFLIFIPNNFFLLPKNCEGTP